MRGRAASGTSGSTELIPRNQTSRLANCFDKPASQQQDDRYQHEQGAAAHLIQLGHDDDATSYELEITGAT